MAGHHSTALTGVKAYLQNRKTGLYLNNKGWWSEKRIKVHFPTIAAVAQYAERSNAEWQLAKK